MCRAKRLISRGCESAVIIRVRVDVRSINVSVWMFYRWAALKKAVTMLIF